MTLLVIGIVFVAYALNVKLIEEMVTTRNLYRKEKDFIKADSIKDLLESNYDVIVTDYPQSSWQFKKKKIEPLNLMEYSKKNDITEVEIEIVKNYLSNLLTHDITDKIGRKYADFAFNFALCGVCDSELYDLLFKVSTKELLRYGNRNSCRLVDVITVLEKLAISGLRNEQFDSLKELLMQKKSLVKDKKLVTVDDVIGSKLSLFSLYPLLSMYSYLSRQPKVTRANGFSFSDDNDINELFHFNNSYPIVLELGCGFGINLLKLQSQYKNFNYIGIDLNSQSIAYSNSIAKRWNVAHQLKFIFGDVKVLIQKLIDLTKNSTSNRPIIDTIIVNFPTPFSVCIYDGRDDSDIIHHVKGNSQLPKVEEEFMLSRSTLEMIQQLFLLQKEMSPTHRNNLYVQSNIEDIIIHVKSEIEQIGRFNFPRNSTDAQLLNSSIFYENDNIFATGELQLNRRQTLVGQKLGVRLKALEYPFLANAPYLSVSETEMHCVHNNKTIHRLLAYI